MQSVVGAAMENTVYSLSLIWCPVMLSSHRLVSKVLEVVRISLPPPQFLAMEKNWLLGEDKRTERRVK